MPRKTAILKSAQRFAEIPADLAAVAAAWPNLAEPIKVLWRNSLATGQSYRPIGTPALWR